MEWQLDKLFSGVPRRVKGLILLLGLLRKQDFAFNARVVLNLRVLKHQLLGTNLEYLQP